MPEPYTPTTEQIRSMCTYDPEYEYFCPDDPGYWRENQARFDRWLSAYTTRIREEALGQVEWEYGWEADVKKRAQMNPRGPRFMFDDQLYTPEQIAAFPKGLRVRRRKAGPWEPVPGGDSNAQ